jgi:hypothetical protein
VRVAWGRGGSRERAREGFGAVEMTPGAPKVARPPKPARGNGPPQATARGVRGTRSPERSLTTEYPANGSFSDPQKNSSVF